jgi:RHS repeat-associated protein
VLDASFTAKTNNCSTIAWNYRYTTRELDPDTRLQLNRNRWYHQSLGRWVNRDPIGYEGGTNLYEYVASDPLSYVDPSGSAFRKLIERDSSRGWKKSSTSIKRTTIIRTP